MVTRSDEKLVLVVDDEPVIRRMLRRTLERARFRVIEAEHGEQAVAILRSGEHDVAAVLSDVSMPVMGGIELTEHVHRAHPGLPVVLSSGLHGHSELAAQLGERLHGYLPKPYTATSVITIVNSALTGAQAEAG